MIQPLPCQRSMFDLPDDVSYLDAASWSLLPTTVRAAGEIGLLTKSNLGRTRGSRFPPGQSGRGPPQPA